MSKIITFTDTIGIDDEFRPQPASNFLPEWYKKSELYVAGAKKPSGFGSTSGTIKKCMPVFDSITAGYIIPSPADVFVSLKDKGHSFEFPSFNLITLHPMEQGLLHPLNKGQEFPKWTNPWSIRTPSGYSCLFVQPFHREGKFTIFPGVVDTDTYTAPIHFPFVMNDPEWEGLIPAGTPVVQVIPFKRDSFNMSFGSLYDLEEQSKVTRKLRSKLFDSYKNQFWHKKSFK